MGIFGNAPPAFLRDNYRRQLVPGAVVKMIAIMDDGKPHEKRFVVVSVTADLNCFVINSAINPLIAKNPKMMKCQAPMELASHPFMTRDSHVDCFRPWKFVTDTVLDELVAGKASMLGRITLPLRDDIVAKLLQSSATPPQQKTTFASSLNTMT